MGRLDHLLLDSESEVIQALVAHRGHLPGRDLLIEIDRVEAIDEDAISIRTGETRPEDLPVYQPAHTRA